jgi:hypothetical protein
VIPSFGFLVASEMVNTKAEESLELFDNSFSLTVVMFTLSSSVALDSDSFGIIKKMTH